MSFLFPLLGGLIGGFGSIFGGETQANAANRAANLQYQLGEQSLDFQKQQWAQQQANLAPWLQQGKASLSELAGLMNTPGQGLLAPFSQTFQAPNAAQAAATPGYQFQLEQGQNAVQNSAGARGGLVSGNAATALDRYSQGLAASNYQQVYNNAMQEYLNNFNIYNTNQANQYNRLASLAGVGQTAATTLGNQGQAAANNVAGIGATIGGQVGQNINNAGAATASGYVGAANAGQGALNGIYGNQLLAALLGGNYGGSGSGSIQQFNAGAANPSEGVIG